MHGFGSQQNHTGTRYFSVSNPYYEAPAQTTVWAIASGVYSNNNFHYELETSQNTTNSRFFELTASDGTPAWGSTYDGFEIKRIISNNDASYGLYWNRVFVFGKAKTRSVERHQPKSPIVSLRGSHKKVCRRYAIYYISSVLLLVLVWILLVFI